MSLFQWLTRGCCVALLLFLVACGGGGDDSTGGSVVTDASQGTSPVDGAAPRLLSQSPAQGALSSVASVVAVRFDEQVTEVAADQFSLMGPEGPVSGEIEPHEDGKGFDFLPDDYLKAYSTYRVVLTDVEDLAGNPLEPIGDWTFVTGFDQLPPELPEFD